MKIYLGLLAAEHECRVAAALAPFDFAWWQSQFSDESPGLMLSVLRLAPGVSRLFFLHSSLGAFTGTSKTEPTDVWRVPQIQFFRLPNRLKASLPQESLDPPIKRGSTLQVHAGSELDLQITSDLRSRLILRLHYLIVSLNSYPDTQCMLHLSTYIYTLNYPNV